MSIRGQGGHLCGWNTNFIEDVEQCFMSSIVEIHAAVAEERPKICQSIRDQGGHLCKQSNPTPPPKKKKQKNKQTKKNLVDDVEFLLSAKISWFISEKVENLKS